MTAADPAAADPFDEWAILELMGHRRAAGRVREVTLAGAGMLRLDIPPTPGHGPQTQYISPSSLYALHPTTEQLATAMAGRWRSEPVSRYELERALPAAPIDADPPLPFEPDGTDAYDDQDDDPHGLNEDEDDVLNHI